VIPEHGANGRKIGGDGRLRDEEDGIRRSREQGGTDCQQS